MKKIVTIKIEVDNDRFTVYEFIELTKNSYGGDIIQKLNL